MRKNISRKDRIRAHETLIARYEEGKLLLNDCPLCEIADVFRIDDDDRFLWGYCKHCTIYPFNMVSTIDAPCFNQLTLKTARLESFTARIVFHKQMVRWLKSGYTLRQIQRRVAKLDEELYEKYKEGQ